MLYEHYQFGGMHLVWWFVWLLLIFWIFATPYEIPFQRTKQSSPLNILQRRFAAGEITKEQYEENRKILQRDLAN